MNTTLGIAGQIRKLTHKKQNEAMTEIAMMIYKISKHQGQSFFWQNWD
uniref:Uncharacterized protein n=1 Tax=Romanomermis culicivorax TaxID=13658 RepID=A0A915IDV7_ROMCU